VRLPRLKYGVTGNAFGRKETALVPRRRIPQYRCYKPKDLGLVVINGKARYLGKYDSEESWERYHRLIADLLTSPPSDPPSSAPFETDTGPTIDELMVAYWDRHVVTYYVKDGRPTSEQDNCRQALRFLRIYGHTPARDFGPKALLLVRTAMIEAGRCRKLINKDINRIRCLFRWATEEELYPGSAYQALRAIRGLAKGRSAAKERPPVGKVSVAVVKATLPYLSAPLAALLKLLLLTGARPGEIAALRPRDVDRSDPAAWTFRPRSHKLEHHGRDRVVMLGPRAQRVLRPWLDRDPDMNCFRPAEAVEARNARSRANRRNPIKPWERKRAPKPDPARAPGEMYGKDAIRWAIRKACAKAGVGPFTANQLRHTRATQIRRKYGIESAQIILGHSNVDTTQIYAERDLSKARQIMARIG
jgi:integrase